MANYAKVNYIQHLLSISERFLADSRLTPWHISLYYSIFQYWNLSKFQNPLSISRTELMKSSKIGSVNTYIKCLKELDAWGYLKYNPSYNPQKGSQVYLYSLNKAADKGKDNSTDKGCDKGTDKGSNKGADNGTDNAAEMPVIPYINNSINNTNNSNERKRENKNKLKENSPSNSKSDEIFQKKSSAKSKTPLPEKRKKVAEKKESHPERSRGARPPRPLLHEVQSFFKEKSWPALEAEKYFNHYQSNGWLVAGKTPMVDWQASASKWMLNAKGFQSGQPPSPLEKGGGMRLQTTNRPLSAVEGKNYNEPL